MALSPAILSAGQQPYLPALAPDSPRDSQNETGREDLPPRLCHFWAIFLLPFYPPFWNGERSRENRSSQQRISKTKAFQGQLSTVTDDEFICTFLHSQPPPCLPGKEQPPRCSKKHLGVEHGGGHCLPPHVPGNSS